MNRAPIGIFDSGLGGLTVTAAVQELMPCEDIIYLGDTARVPYGDKSPETVLRFGCENAAFMAEKGVKLIIVACNTVSALAINGIRDFFKKEGITIPLITVLEAGVNRVIEKDFANIAVIGTRGTVASGAYSCELRKKSPGISVRSIACPLFAPIVEEGLYNHKIAKIAIDIYLQPLLKDPPEALLLACTHYPLLMDALRSYIHPTVKIIDSAHAVATLAEYYLHTNYLKTDLKDPGKEEFYVTDSPEFFTQKAEDFMARDITPAQKVIKNRT